MSDEILTGIELAFDEAAVIAKIGRNASLSPTEVVVWRELLARIHRTIAFVQALTQGSIGDEP